MDKTSTVMQYADVGLFINCNLMVIHLQSSTICTYSQISMIMSVATMLSVLMKVSV